MTGPASRPLLMAAASALYSCPLLLPSAHAPSSHAVSSTPPSCQVASLLDMHWDHIIFTGSERVGKIVAASAARHLTPTTLELGGKCPVIIAEDAEPLSRSMQAAQTTRCPLTPLHLLTPLQLLPPDVLVNTLSPPHAWSVPPPCVWAVADKILWGRLLNAGQSCVAPEYVLLPRESVWAFADALVATLAATHGESLQDSPHLGRVCHPHSASRLASLMVGHGGKVVCGGSIDSDSRYVAPTIIVDPSPNSPVMNEECFGPVLCLLGVDSLDDAIAYALTKPTPVRSQPQLTRAAHPFLQPR